MKTCNSEKIITNTRNIVFAANNLYVASSLLKNTHYDISNAILELASYLMTEISTDEREEINKAIEDITSTKV